MLFKRHYFIVAALIIIALVVSFMLMPGRHEYALMELKDKRFEEARAAYEQEQAHGNVSLETANNLTDLYLQVGAVDKAIATLEKFVADHPNRLDARIKLGKLYQFAQRPDDYLHNLEEINRINAQPENLKTLSDIYNFRGEYGKQEGTLKQLIKDDKGQEARHYTDLATIQAAKHDYTGAIATLAKLQKDHPEQFNFADTALLVSLYLDNKQPQDAENLADNWVSAHHNPDEGAQLINILHFKGGIGDKVVAHFTDKEIDSDPALLESYVLLLLGEGKDDQAFQRLKGLYDNAKLPPQLNGRLLYLAASRGDHALTHQMLKSTDLTTLSELQLVGLVELSLVEQDKLLLADITAAFSDSTLLSHYPMLSAALSVANHKADADEQLARLDPLPLTNEQILQMANVCGRVRKNGCVDHMLSRLPEQDKLSDNDVANIGGLYYDIHEWDKGYKYIELAMQSRRTEEIGAVKVRFDAARGNTAAVQTWITAHPNVSPHVLADLYYAAMNNGQNATAMGVAEVYHDKYNSSLSRTLLANAYIRAGRYESAITLLRENNPRSEDDENNYVAALAYLSRHHPEYRRELAQYASTRLNSGIPQSRKMALIYALINAKEADVAMPAIRELALRNGGQWSSLYADMLEKQHRYAEARNFWVQVAAQPHTSKEQRQYIAYALLDHGYKSDAEHIFRQLAENASAGSTEVKDILYIWGPRPDGQQMLWLEARYTRAEGAEKDRWAMIIGDYSTSDFLVGFVSRHPESMGNQRLAAAYMQALADEGSLPAKREEFVSHAKETHDATMMQEFATAALDNNYNHEARVAYETIVSIQPDNMVALRQAGVANFDEANYTASSRYLGRYVQEYKSGQTTDPRAYEAFFYYGELLRHDHRMKDAKPYYRQSLALMGNSDSAEMESKRAQSQIWSGDVKGGIDTFNTARKMHPGNDDLQADYVSTLAEMERYSDARTALPASATAAAPKPTMAEAPLPSFSQKAAKYTLLNNNTQLLVQFDRPMTQSDTALAQTFRNIPGISYTNEAYDSTLIVAMLGYKFRMNGDVPTIVADGDSAVTVQANQRLRYNLLEARLDLADGKVYKAAKELNALAPEYKNNSQLMAFTANAENYGGNWPRAEELLTAAHQLSPDNNDITALLRDARREHAQNIRLDYDWINIGDSHENVETLSGYVNAAPHTQVGAVLQDAQVHASNVRLANGQVGSFSRDRQQGEIYAQYNMQNGQLLRASVFGNNDTAGVGGYYHFLNPLGETQIAAEWHRPYWNDVVEAPLDDANRDRIAIQHIIKPAPRWSIAIEPGLNRYNTSSQDNVESTFSGGLLAVYRYLERERLTVDLGYQLDAEYELNHKEALDDTGNVTRLFPLNSREIHMLFADTGYTFSSFTYGDVLVGYEYDRLGGNGPVISGKLTHEINQNWDVQLRAYYGLDAQSSHSSLTDLGAYVRLRF